MTLSSHSIRRVERKRFRFSLDDSVSGQETRSEFGSTAFDSAQSYVTASQALTDRAFWPLKLYCAHQLWLWHLDAFALECDPVPLFADAMARSRDFLRQSVQARLSALSFPISLGVGEWAETDIQTRIGETFGDIWVHLSDDIYFDQSYALTRERFEKSGVHPERVFGDKVVLDAGCGSGKFSAALARMGAAKVIGLDISERALAFARVQAEKVSYGNRLEFRQGSLLDIPLPEGSVDAIWSNGVIHHTLDYERCVAEFARVLRPGGTLYLYVNGRFGLFELLADAIRLAIRDVPRALYVAYLLALGVNSGRLYWILDYAYPPYEWKSRNDVIAILHKYGFADIRQLTRGVATDQIEQVTMGLPYAAVKYGEAQLKFLAVKR